MQLTFDNLHKDIQKLIDEEICDYVHLDKSELKNLMLEHHYDDVVEAMVYQDNDKSRKEAAIVYTAKFIQSGDKDWLGEAREYLDKLVDESIESIYEDIKEERAEEVGA